MRKFAPAVLVAAFALHGAMLVGWRWQYPVVPYFFDATVLTGGRGIDFYSIYQAGYNARQGVDIYENDPAKITVVVPHFTPYRYLPIVAYTLGAALSRLPSLTAYKIWLVVIEMTLFACVFFAWRSARDRRLSMLLAAMWLGFTPFYLELFMGQFSLVQAALIFGLFLAAEGVTPATKGGENPIRSNATFSATFGVASLWITSVLWKINTVVFAPVFLRQRHFRILFTAALLVALVTLPYFFIFPAHGPDFLRNNFGGGVAGYELGNLGFRQLTFELLAALGAPAAIQAAVQLAVILAVLFICLGLTFPLDFRSRTREAGRTNAAPQPSPWALGPVSVAVWPPACGPSLSALLGLWLAAFFLSSPQVWENHYLMLLPALIIAFRQAWGKPEAWLVFLIWLAIALPTPFGFIGLQPQIASNYDLRGFALYPLWRPLLEHACKAAPTLLFFGYQARALMLKLRTT